MRKHKSLLAAAVGLTAAVAIATPAWAVSVGGGDWDYGISLGFNYSYYQHYYNNHSSSVNSNGTVAVSGCQTPGNLAAARTWESLYNNKAYWNNAC
ncbi:lactococcin 972 family bacteriocin [Dactylosporangium sp. NPDC048998]|uniref:lactococcin 972 family bacteriocin n=1 Tax=Dactylosporangium sp. NPDC048998 TaxID=3363976 RepID=UPI003716E861